MDRKTSVKENIEKFGQSVRFIMSNPEAENVTTKAFIQPLRQVSRSYQWENYLDSGLVDLSNYVYIGPYDVRIDTFPKDTVLESKGKKYTIQTVDTVNIGDETIYIWAVLQICTEEELK